MRWVAWDDAGVLTGRETAPATFAATAHRHRDRPALVEVLADGARRTTSWGALARTVRHLSVALADDGFEAGQVLAVDVAGTAGDRATTLLVGAAVGAVLAVDAGAPIDVGGLLPRGVALDERRPDRFERLVAERRPHDVLLRCGAVDHTHASLLIAARSLAQGAGLGVDDRLLVDLSPGSAADAVLSVIVPCLTGAASWTSPTDFAIGDLDEASGPTFVASTDAAPEAATSSRRLGRRRPAAPSRSIVVVGDGGAAGPPGDSGPSLVALSVEAAGGVVAGFGVGHSMGRPLPGVTLAIDDDGGVLVRSGGVAPGAPGLRDDGWLATGRRGRLDGGALVLDREPATLGAA